MRRFLLLMLLCVSVAFPQRHRNIPVSGTPAWTPASVDSLKFWVESTTLSLNNGDSVATWNDGSGKGYNLTHRTGLGAKKPTYQTSVSSNGKPAVRFNIAGPCMLSADSLCQMVRGNDVPFTFFLCGKLRSWDEAYAGCAWWTFGGDVDATIRATQVGQAADRAFDHRRQDDASASVVREFYSATDTAAMRSTGFVLSWTFKGLSQAIYLNQTSKDSAATNVGVCNPRNFSLGDGYIWGSLQLPSNIDIFAVLLYRSALTSANRQLVEAYLKTTYGTP